MLLIPLYPLEYDKPPTLSVLVYHILSPGCQTLTNKSLFIGFRGDINLCVRRFRAQIDRVLGSFVTQKVRTHSWRQNGENLVAKHRYLNKDSFAQSAIVSLPHGDNGQERFSGNFVEKFASR